MWWTPKNVLHNYDWQRPLRDTGSPGVWSLGSDALRWFGKWIPCIVATKSSMITDWGCILCRKRWSYV